MSDPQNPWGNRGPNKPGDFEDLIKKGIKNLFGDGGKKPPFGQPPTGGEPKSTRNMGVLFLLIFIGMILSQSFYQINPGEQGVILRFGRFNSTSQPGLNFLIPLIDKVIKVDVESIRKEEFGIRRNALGTLDGGDASFERESLMLTSDLNVIQASWVVQYKIRDPEMFLFNIESPRAAVRDISESVVRRLAGNRDFSYLLNNREELASGTQKEMQELLDKYNSGIQLVVVQFQDVNPPDPVRPSFNEVNEAEQDRIRLGNEAQKEFNEKIPRAKGIAQRKIQEAEGYKIQKVNIAKGDVARFNSILKEYKKAKEVTRTRLYIDTLKETLPNVQDVIIIDQSGKGSMPLINIGAAVAAPKTAIKE